MLRRNFLTAGLVAIGGMLGWKSVVKAEPTTIPSINFARIISHEKSISPHYLDEDGYLRYWIKGKLVVNDTRIPLPIEGPHEGFRQIGSIYDHTYDNNFPDKHNLSYEIHYKQITKPHDRVWWGTPNMLGEVFEYHEIPPLSCLPVLSGETYGPTPDYPHGYYILNLVLLWDKVSPFVAQKNGTIIPAQYIFSLPADQLPPGDKSSIFPLRG